MIGAYFRVSTSEQKENKTIETQIFGVGQFVKQAGETIDKEYKDDGWSGSLLARPSLDQLREDIKSGLITKLYVYHPDRLSRKQSFQFLLLDEFEKAGVKVMFTSLPDYFLGNKESQIVNKSIFAMVSELERVRITERFRLGKLRKINEGQLICSKPAYGFIYNPKDKKLSHDPEEIENVKLILDWAKEGKSMREIILALKEKGICTRSGGLNWAKSTIAKVININLLLYAGHWNFNKYRSTSPLTKTSKLKYSHRLLSSRRLNPREDWLGIELPKNLAIITDEDARLIRARQDKNKVQKKYTSNFYMLRGKIYCDHCQGLEYSDSFHGKSYYRCGDKKRKFPEKDYCPAGSIKASAIEDGVWNKLVDFVSDKKLIEEQVDRFIASNRESVSDGTELASIVKEKTDLLKEKQKLSEGYTKGLIDDADMSLQKTRITNRLDLLSSKEKQLFERQTQASSVDLTNIDIVSMVASELRAYTPEERQKSLDWLGVKVFINNKSYRIEGVLPLNAKSCPQLIHNVYNLLQSSVTVTIPFTLHGTLEQESSFPFAYAQ